MSNLAMSSHIIVQEINRRKIGKYFIVAKDYIIGRKDQLLQDSERNVYIPHDNEDPSTFDPDTVVRAKKNSVVNPGKIYTMKIIEGYSKLNNI